MFQFPAINIERIQSVLNSTSNVNSKSLSIGLKSNAEKSAQNDADAKGSSCYGEFGGDDDSMIEFIASKDCEISKGTSINNQGTYDVKDPRNTLEPPKRQQPAAVQSTSKTNKSPNADIYDFDEGDDGDEPVAKKPKRRRRRLVQPKMGAKLARFVRRKLLLRERRKNSSFGSNLVKLQMPLKKVPTRKWSKSFATVASSGMDKLGIQITPNLLEQKQAAGIKDSPPKTGYDSNEVREPMSSTL